MFDPLSLCRDARRFPAMNGRSLPVRTLRHSSKLVLPILIAVLTAVATMGIVGGLSTADHGTVGPSTESLLARGAIAPPAVSGSTPLTSSATSPPVYETGTVVAAFGLQGWPTEVAYDSANGEVYVANNLATNVSVISGTAVVASVNVHRAPFGVAYDSGNGEVYVTDSDNVSLISGTAVVATFGLQGGPGALAYDSGNGEVFIANSEWGSVSVISGTTVVANVSVQGGPAAVAYDSENGEVYVVNEFSNSVSVISGTTVVANVSVQSYPAGVAYDSGNGEVYVADSGSNNVSVISGTTVVATVGVQGEPTAVVYDSGNGDVYVGNYENSVSVISGTNLLATIFDNYGAFDAAYDSGNGEVYVANYGSNSMYVISTMLDLGGLAGRTALDVGQAASLSAAVIGPGAGITRVSAQVSPSTGFSCSPNASSNARVSISCQASSAGSYTVTLYAVDELGNGVWTSCLVNVYTDPSVLHPIPSRPSADCRAIHRLFDPREWRRSGERVSVRLERPGRSGVRPLEHELPDLSSLGPGGVGDRECQRNRRGWVHVIDRVQSVLRLGGPHDWGTSCLPRNLGRGAEHNPVRERCGRDGSLSDLYVGRPTAGLPERQRDESGLYSVDVGDFQRNGLTPRLERIQRGLRDPQISCFPGLEKPHA